MSKFDILTIYAQVIGFSSTVFMVYTFINEAFFGHGVYFFEPNRPLATGELAVALIGLVILGFLMFSTGLYSMKKSKLTKDTEQPYGFVKSDRAYQ